MSERLELRFPRIVQAKIIFHRKTTGSGHKGFVLVSLELYSKTSTEELL